MKTVEINKTGAGDEEDQPMFLDASPTSQRYPGEKGEK
jgi:hypothetical protein